MVRLMMIVVAAFAVSAGVGRGADVPWTFEKRLDSLEARATKLEGKVQAIEKAAVKMGLKVPEPAPVAVEGLVSSGCAGGVCTSSPPAQRKGLVGRLLGR